MVHRTDFCDLALCILLNSAACFSRLKEFERVGQVCSIILDYQPNNVKAMYRMAIAAVELGKHEWTYWDLVLAGEISPTNQEVVKKLEEVKSFVCGKKSKDQTQGDCPKGLGLGLPPLSKNSSDHPGKDHTFKSQESLEKDPIIVEKEGGRDHCAERSKEIENRKFSDLESKQLKGCQNVSDVSRDKDEDGVKDESMEDIGKSQSTCESSSTITDEVDNLSTLGNDEKSETVNLAEPEYRFHNRRRQGSNLAISKSNYLLMTQGKTLKFYNAKLGSFMEVKIAGKLEEKVIDNGDYHSCERGPMHCVEHSSPRKGNAESEEIQSELGSCVTYEDDQDNYGEAISQLDEGYGVSPQELMLSHINFVANSKNKARRNRHDIKSHGPTKVPIKDYKRRKLHIDKNVLLFTANFECGCRFKVGQKRKCAHLLPLDFCHHPKKKFAPNVCLTDQCSSCPLYCTNNSKEASTSLNGVVRSRAMSSVSLVMQSPKDPCPTHEMAIRLSNGDWRDCIFN